MTEDYKLSNREKGQLPRGNKFWCGSCDDSLVSAGTKCLKCGARNGKTNKFKYSRRNIV